MARKIDTRHELPSPYPVHFHGRRYIVDQMCQCGRKRSEHADTNEYGGGASFDGACAKFRFHAFVEDPPWNWQWGSKRKAAKQKDAWLEEFLEQPTRSKK